MKKTLQKRVATLLVTMVIFATSVLGTSAFAFGKQAELQLADWVNGITSLLGGGQQPVAPAADFTGVAYYTYNGETTWWAFEKGEVKPDAKGFYSNSQGTWYVKNGKVDFTVTGLVKNGGYRWYVLDGKLQDGYSGKVSYKGITYTTANGKVTGGATQAETDAVKVLNTVGWDFKKAYYWTINNITYDKYSVPVDGSYGVDNYAINGFEKKRGNCYTFSSCVYYLGRMCNESIRVIKGTVPHVGGTQGAHSWNEVDRNGTVYVLDAQYEQQWRNKGKQPYSGYLFTYGTKGSLVYTKQATLAR